MLAFILSPSRCSASLVMLAVSFLCFALFNFVGDPVNDMVGQEATPAERAEMRRELGLEESVRRPVRALPGQRRHRQFRQVATAWRRPVSDLIVERMPATLELVAARRCSRSPWAYRSAC